MKPLPCTRLYRFQCRHASNATQTLRTNLGPPSSQTHYINERLRAKNILNNLGDILPQALQIEKLQDEAWSERLSRATKKLSREGSDPTIAIWSPMPNAGRDVITALLEDPLSSDDNRRALLARRWQGRQGNSLKLIYADVSETISENKMAVSAPWLRATGGSVLELTISTHHSLIAQLEDIEIIVVVVESLSDLQREDVQAVLKAVEFREHVHVILNNKKFTGISAPLATLTAITLSSGPFNAEVHVLSSEGAIDAQANFRRDQINYTGSSSQSPSYSDAVNRFQASVQASGLPQLSQRLQASFKLFRDPSSAIENSVRSALATSLLAVNQSYYAVETSQIELLEAQTRVEELRAVVVKQSRETKHEVFRNGEMVPLGAQPSRDAITTYLNQMPWWKLTWRIDGLAADISAILNSSYGRDVERTLGYQAGRIERLQARFNENAIHAVTFPPASPLNSALLVNSLDQLSSHDIVSPMVLTGPVEQRRAQLQKYPLMYLHYNAQKLVLQMYVFSLAGPAAAWGSWATGFVGQEIALSAGALSAALGLRWVVGRWENIKRNWWESWDRVNAGMERDLEDRFDYVMRSYVFAKTVRAADGLDAIASQRKESLRALVSDLDKVSKDIQELSQVSGTLRSQPRFKDT